MLDDGAEPPSFVELGSSCAPSPVVLAVPHAGRAYPPELIAQSRLGFAALELLADRDVDRLLADAVAAGASAVVATRPRAWIDLNRDPREIDPAMVEPPPRRDRLISTAKSRSGLGLIPRRVPGHGDILSRPLAPDALARRIDEVHAPYHRTLAAAVARARARFGVAVLLDVHSMPPLGGADPARVIVGDRHGISAGRSITALVLDEARSLGRVAANDPYAGGYTLERHGRPHRAIHAVQLEFDRDLYLAADGTLDENGRQRVTSWLAGLVMRIGDLLASSAIAAE